MAEPSRPQTRCAIYTRKSSEEGLEQEFNSLDAQREACAAYILSQRHEGWILIPEHYDDGGYSGGSMDRPGLIQLMADMRAGKIDIIVVYKVDRLTRSLSDFAKMVDIFDQAKASFVSVTQAFNTTTSMGRLTLNVLLSFAQFEREVTGERIRDKIAASKKKGIFMGGGVPLGYDVKDRKLIINEREAEHIRHIMQRYVALRSVRDLIHELTHKDIMTKVTQLSDGRIRGGIPFRPGGLLHILKNRVYLGEIVHKGNWYPGEHQGIISQELWDNVQAVLANGCPVRPQGTRKAQPNLLNGLIFDGEHRRMYPSHAVKTGRRYRYYITHPGKVRKGDTPAWRMPAHDLEQLVIEQLCAFLTDPGRIAQGVHTKVDAATLDQLLQRAAGDAITLRTADAEQQRALLQRRLCRIVIGERLMEMTIILAADLHHKHEVTLAKVRRGVDVKLVIGSAPMGNEPFRNEDLVVLITDAWQARDAMIAKPNRSIEQAAQDAGIGFAWFRRLLRLSYLAPDIIEAILMGKQPASMNVRQLGKVTNIPLDWAEQKRFFELA